MGKLSLRDVARDSIVEISSIEYPSTPDPGISFTKEEQAGLIHGLRQQTLARIKAVTQVTQSTKIEKYDRIVEILEGHSNDIRNVLSRRTID